MVIGLLLTHWVLRRDTIRFGGFFLELCRNAYRDLWIMTIGTERICGYERDRGPHGWRFVTHLWGEWRDGTSPVCGQPDWGRSDNLWHHVAQIGVCGPEARPISISWWCHQMETFSALLAICAGNSPVSGEFPAQKASDADLWCFLCSVISQQHVN